MSLTGRYEMVLPCDMAVHSRMQPAADPVRMRELPQEPGLPHAGLARHRHDLAVPGGRPLSDFAELVHLVVASDERREAADRGGLQARAHRAEPDQFEDFHRQRQPLHRNRADRAHLDVALRQAERLRGEERGARARQLLHARGQVRRLSDGRVIHVQVVIDGAHHDLAGVQSDADLHVQPLSPSQPLRVGADGLLHAHGRPAGAHGVVLVRQRRPEQRHDAVAHDLVHRALVAMHRFHHPLEDRVEQPPRFLGIAIGEQLHRSFEVGEEHGDLLALALEGGARGQDLVGEMLGRVALRRGVSLDGRRDRGRAAGAAEPLVRKHLRAAVGAREREFAPALLAEPNALTVLGLTPRTRHRTPPAPLHQNVLSVSLSVWVSAVKVASAARALT